MIGQPDKTTVCPGCGYAFQASGDELELRCPRSQCRHVWPASGLTVSLAYSTEKRDAEYQLNIVAGDIPATFQLSSRPSIIGRDEGCDIRLTNLQASRRHAEVLLRGGQVWVRDLGSSSGTLLERERIDEEPAELKLGQRIIIGGAALQLEIRYKPKSENAAHVDSRKAIRDSLELQVLVDGEPVERFDITDQPLSIGRQDDRHVVLKHPMVSRKHAQVARDGERVYVLDTGSGSGTYVNGKAVLRKDLHKGDRLQVGPFLFLFDGDGFTRQSELSKLNLVALDLTKGNAKEKFLDSVSLCVQPGEFVGVLGPSGAGKSTLMNALNGLRPASSGVVLLNGMDLYENYDQWRTSIGFVPQEDIIHSELTVRDAITYAARLRLPSDSTPENIRVAVDNAIKTVSLGHRVKSPVALLSGGERKRVSVAVELVGNPSLLFLDEPTAALDPGNAGTLMRTFRDMADQGRTLICTTHIMENLDLFDKVVVLVRGKLAYFGPPLECMNHFGVRKFVDLYDRLSEKKPEEWQEMFASSPDFTAFVDEPTAPFREHADLDSSEFQRGDARPRTGRWGELFTLTSRYLKVFFADLKSIAGLLAQALIVGLLINWVCTNFALSAFLTQISCLWFGCNRASREIVRERAIFARERMVGQNVTSYYLSKAIVLLAVVLVQTAVMSALMYAITGVEGSFWRPMVILGVTAVCGTLQGLLISCFVKNEMAAVTLVPLALIPQIVLAGALMPVPYMHYMGKALSNLAPTRWSNHAMDCSILTGEKLTPALLESHPVSIQNCFPDYDLRNPEKVKLLLTAYGGKILNLSADGELALLVVLVICFIAMSASLFILYSRKPGT